MAFGNHAEMGPQSELKVRPAATDEYNSPQLRSKKAKTLNMSVGHRFDTDYALSAVMLSWRGDAEDRHEQHGEIVQQNFNKPETVKKSSYGPTPQKSGAVGASKAGSTVNSYF